MFEETHKVQMFPELWLMYDFALIKLEQCECAALNNLMPSLNSYFKMSLLMGASVEGFIVARLYWLCIKADLKTFCIWSVSVAVMVDCSICLLRYCNVNE